MSSAFYASRRGIRRAADTLGKGSAAGELIEQLVLLVLEACNGLDQLGAVTCHRGRGSFSFAVFLIREGCLRHERPDARIVGDIGEVFELFVGDPELFAQLRDPSPNGTESAFDEEVHLSECTDGRTATGHTCHMDIDRWGVADGWQATDGSWRDADPDTLEHIARAQGAAVHPEGPPTGPPLWFIRTGESHPLQSRCLLSDERGSPLGELDSLPPDLPVGLYDLQPVERGPSTTLFVVPTRAVRPARGWGWSAQLYGARSRRSWGIGNLSDLHTLAEWAEHTGASLLAHNPLGAAMPFLPQQPSPYYPSSRRHISPLYLDLGAIPGAELVDPALMERWRAAGEAMNARPRIDRDAVWELLEPALAAIHAATAVRDAEEITAASTDRDLRAYGVFCALAEHHRTGWQDWPAAHRHPDSDAVAAFALRHAERVRFHIWVQLRAREQLTNASRAGATLMGDLPVGFDPGGFDAWIDQDLLALDCSIGAPPDDLGPTGQDWGLPPYVPWKLRAAAYRPWVLTLRQLCSAAGALRIDHVMGLFRLFWIPRGLGPNHGAYVYQPGTELLDVALMVAAQAGVTVIGEDLGTVEPQVRSVLADRGVYGYRVAWFEDDAPATWPRTTLASLTTHDLPTVAGLWNGTDAADRAAAGLAPMPQDDAVLRGRLRTMAGVADEAPDREVIVEAHRALAGSGSDLAMVTLEDAVGVSHRPNVPGTIDEHPNWRLALPVPIEDLDNAGAAEIAQVMNEFRRPDGSRHDPSEN